MRDRPLAELAAMVAIAMMWLAVFAFAARADERPPLDVRARAWVVLRQDASFRFGPVGARRGWPSLDWVRDELVPAAVEAAQGAVFPEAWPDAETLLSLAWRESRWRPGEVGRFVTVNGRVVRGRGGELGVCQLKPAICRRYLQPGETCADTRVNLRIAATILREHLATCGAGRIGYALHFYASGNGCAPPRYGDRAVMRWSEQLRRMYAPSPETVADEPPPAQELGSWSAARGAP